MGVKSADEIRGFEFDWLASDANGNVAFLSTAGGGYAPEEFLREIEAHDAAIDAILSTPACTTARVAPQLSSGLQNLWHLMAERGVFAFDADPHGGPYRLVAVPKEPVCIADLPDAAAAVVRRLSFHGLKFSEVQEITAGFLARRR